MAEHTPRIAIVATVKAPLSQLGPWVNYHLNIGIDSLVLYFDDPGDAAIPILDAIDQVTVIPCSDAFWKAQGKSRPGTVEQRQVVNVNHGFELAREAGHDWAAHIDSDELIRPLTSLVHQLGMADADMLKLDMREAASEFPNYASVFDARLFKTAPNRLQQWVAGLLCRRAVLHGEYFRGHTESKMIVRLGSQVSRMGVHKPISQNESAKIQKARDIQLLHFDCVGFEDWDTKWAARNDGLQQFGRMRPARVMQLDAYAEASRHGLQARQALFQRHQVIPAAEVSILERMGLLERIEMDPQLFLQPGARETAC